MRILKIGVATRCFGLPFKQAVLAASETGAQGIQVDSRNELKPSELTGTGVRQLLHQLHERNLCVASVDFPTRRAYSNPDQLDERLAATKTAMEFAYELNSRVLTTRIGRVPSDTESHEYRLLGDMLNDLARHGNRIGVTFCITPTNDSPEELARLIGAVDQGPIGINFDPARFVMAGHNSGDAFRCLHQLVTHVMVRDAVRDVDGSLSEVTVGRGEVAWDELLALLNDAEYPGWLTIERTAGDDKATDMSRAVQYLRRVAMEG